MNTSLAFYFAVVTRGSASLMTTTLGFMFWTFF